MRPKWRAKCHFPSEPLSYTPHRSHLFQTLFFPSLKPLTKTLISRNAEWRAPSSPFQFPVGTAMSDRTAGRRQLFCHLQRGTEKQGKTSVERGSWVLGLLDGAAPARGVGRDHWNLELGFSIASLVLSKEKIGFLESSPVQAIMLKLLR